MGLAILMTFEHAPWRKRGKYTAIPQVGVPLGVFLANVASLASANLGDQLAWRVPFMLSAVLIIAGMIIRLKVSESPEFEESKARGEIVKNPVLTVIKDDWRTVLRVIALRLAETGGFYVIVTYLISYITTAEMGGRELALTGLIIATAIGSFTTVAWGTLSDRIGRRRLYAIGSAATVAFGFPLFLMVNTAAPMLIVLAYIIARAVIHDLLAGAQGAYFSERFARNTRTSGASLGYQFSAAISGFIPFTAASLAISMGWAGVALIYVGVGLIGLLGVALTRETWGPKEKAAVEEVIRTGEPALATR